MGISLNKYKAFEKWQTVKKCHLLFLFYAYLLSEPRLNEAMVPILLETNNRP